MPAEGDPPTVRWCGHTFHANVPKDVTHAGLIQAARMNKFFKVGEFDPNDDHVKSQPQATKSRASVRSRATTRLLPSNIDLILEIAGRRLEKLKKLHLLSDINGALDIYAREISNEKQGTLKQFGRKFNSMRESLKRLRISLPSPGDRLFEAVRRHGEAYAKKHGPHRGISERILPRMNIKELNQEEVDYRSD